MSKTNITTKLLADNLSSSATYQQTYPNIFKPQANTSRRRAIDFPSTDTVSAVLGRCAHDQTLHDGFLLGTLVYHTGIRPSELRKLLWSAVDLERGELTIDSKSAQRILKLDAEARHALMSLRRSAHESRCVLGKSPNSRLRRAATQLRHVCNVLGHPTFGLHRLRWAYTARLVNAGVPMALNARLLGLRPPSFLRLLSGGAL